MNTITTEELQQEIDDADAPLLVDVLPEDAFAKGHLPGAINVPMNDDFEDAIRENVPQKDRRVVVYCQNTECPLSERAARKMEALGYENVLDYDAGKEGWTKGGGHLESETNG